MITHGRRLPLNTFADAIDEEALVVVAVLAWVFTRRVLETRAAGVRSPGPVGNGQAAGPAPGAGPAV